MAMVALGRRLGCVGVGGVGERCVCGAKGCSEGRSLGWLTLSIADATTYKTKIV